MKGHVRAAILIVVALATATPFAAQGDHWVGTWGTAVVARGLGPQGPGPFGRGPGGPPAAPGQPPQGVPPAPPGVTPPPLGVIPPQGQPPATTTSTSGAPAGPPAPGPGRGFGGPPLNFTNQTLRQIVHASIGGDRVRVVFSNAYGTTPLVVGGAQIAVRDKAAAVVANSGKALTFNGSPSVTIPAGASIISDAAALTVPNFADLAIDLYLPETTEGTTVTMHTGALQTNYVSTAGNHVGEPDLPVATTTQSWFFLARVEVTAPSQAGALVAFGDSITDGTRSTPDTNNRWPDQLARRLAAQNIRMGIINEGIAGNRVLADGAGVSALARFDRDALVQTGVTHVIVLESINDIGIARANPSPTADDLIAGHKQLIERAHARGLRIYGATLTPFEGAAYWSSEGEAKRQAVNQWIRTSKAYDGVVDFDAAVRDPNSPTKLLPQFNPGDNLHMTDAGYQTMANAIDLALLKKK
jgi:lysophospholipase L1-like esterase